MQILIHHDEYAGVRMTVVRRFKDTGLRQVRYFNRERHATPESYVEDFHAVRTQLVQLYGEPEIDEVSWTSEEFRNQPAMHAKAMAAGHVRYTAAWREDTTRILMVLVKENLQIAHSLTFTDPATVPDG